MKRFIKNIILFLIGVAIIDICISWSCDYMQSHAKGGGVKMLNDLVAKDTHDIIVLGSSRAQHHYDSPFLSDTLNLDCYNAGYDGMGVVFAYGLLEMILERYNPKLVIFDCEPGFDVFKLTEDNNNVRYISKLKPYYRDKAIGNIIKEINYKDWITVHSGMVRNNSILVSLLIANFFQRPTLPNGYGPLSGVIDVVPENKDIDNREVDTTKVRYIYKMIDLVKKKNVNIVFVASPRYGRKTTAEFSVVKKICKEKGVHFIDHYTDSIYLNHTEWFKDINHLNTAGARNFSRQVAKDIKEFLGQE